MREQSIARFSPGQDTLSTDRSIGGHDGKVRRADWRSSLPGRV